MPSEPHPHGRVQSQLAPLEDTFRQPILSSLPEKELGSVPPQLILPRHASQKFDELVIRVGATNLQPVSHTHAVAITKDDVRKKSMEVDVIDAIDQISASRSAEE